MRQDLSIDIVLTILLLHRTLHTGKIGNSERRKVGQSPKGRVVAGKLHSYHSFDCFWKVFLTIHTGIRIQLLRERDQKCLVEDPGRAWRDSDPPIRKSTSGGSARARSSRTASQWSWPWQADKNKAGSGWDLPGNTAAQHSCWLSIRTIIILTVITDRKCSHCEARNCKGSTKAALEAA